MKRMASLPQWGQVKCLLCSSNVCPQSVQRQGRGAVCRMSSAPSAMPPWAKISKQPFRVCGSTQEMRPSSQVMLRMRRTRCSGWAALWSSTVFRAILSSPWTRLASCILVSGLALRAGDAGVDTVGDQGHVGHGAVAHHDAQGLPVHVRRHAPLESGRDVRAVGTDVVEDFAAGRFAAGAGFGRVDLAHGHAVGAFGHAFAALADELEGFEDLVQAHHGAGVDAAAVMGDALELQVGIGRIGRILAHVDGDAGTARHGAHHAQAQGVFPGQQAQALGTAQDHGVGGIDLADLIHGGLHLVDHAQDVLEHVRGHVALDAADAVGGQVHAVAVHGLLHVLHQ